MAVTVRRLKVRQNFLKVKAEGRRASAQGFVLQWMEMPEEAGLGVGFTASGALGNAVHRNRARRRVKAAFDEVCRCNAEAVGQGKWLVLVAKLPVFEMEYKYLLRDMQKVLGEAGITCGA